MLHGPKAWSRSRSGHGIQRRFTLAAAFDQPASLNRMASCARRWSCRSTRPARSVRRRQRRADCCTRPLRHLYRDGGLHETWPANGARGVVLYLHGWARRPTHTGPPPRPRAQCGPAHAGRVRRACGHMAAAPAHWLPCALPQQREAAHARVAPRAGAREARGGGRAGVGLVLLGPRSRRRRDARARARRAALAPARTLRGARCSRRPSTPTARW